MASTKDPVDFSFSPSRIQIKNAARREILEAWQQRWSGSSNATWTYSLLSKVDYKRIYGDFFLNHVVTGHGVFLVIKLACLARIPNIHVEEPTVMFFECSLNARS
ncbi:hypothetical protein AVEN_186663-1 [Araneus ventricosus]|uniref:Uncharacterized protein n=1 Tax=Araneus ventricosus TaxID=182803 RepID=A0A4Y2QIS2_ARAVE|nr:hypothetical protein AVEN_186663-1 [Araneus ventricosus]